MYFALPKWPIHQLKPVKQSRQQVLRAYCPNVDSLGTSQKRRRPAQRKGSAEQKDGSCRLKELYQQTKMSSQQAESKAQPQLVEIFSEVVFLFLFTRVSAGNETLVRASNTSSKLFSWMGER